MRYSLSILLCAAIALAGCGEEAVSPRLEELACPAPAAGTVADGCTDLRNFIHTIGVINTDGDATAVALAGGTAYVADGEAGVLVVDACDAARPRVLSRITTDEAALDVAAWNGRLFVATAGGLEVFDVSDPGAPRRIGSVRGAGRYRSVAIDADRRLAFVADDVAGLVIYDIAVPQWPKVLGVENTTGEARDVSVQGNVAYVADAVVGLRIVSVQSPEAPWLIRAVETPGEGAAVTVWNRLALVADGPAGLTVIDVAAPNAAAVVGNLDSADYLQDVTVCDGVVFAAERSQGLLLYDLADPSSPRVAVRLPGEGRAVGVNVSAGVAFIAAGRAGLRVVDARTPSRAPESGRLLPLGGSANAVAAVGNRFYVADANIGLYSAEWRGDHFARLGDIHPGDAIHDLVLYEGFLYLCANDLGVLIVDPADPARPVIVGGIQGTAGAVDVALADSVIFTVRGGFSSPTIVDLRNQSAGPTGIRLRLGVTSAVAVGDAFAYFVQLQGRLFVVSRDPAVSDPVVRSQVTRGASTDIHVRDAVAGGGQRMFIASSRGSTDPETGQLYSAGVEVYDLADPAFPEFVTLIQTAIPAERITFDGDIMYVAGEDDGLEILDVTDPFAPVAIGSYWRESEVRDVVAVPGATLLAAGDDGIIALPPPCE